MPEDARQYYPITENQRGFYIDWEMNQDTTQYNMPSIYVFAEISATKLADAVRKAVDLHPYLKTRFVNMNGEILQEPHEDEVAKINITELQERPKEQITAYDYAVYEQEFLKSDKLNEMEAYFDNLLNGVSGASLHFMSDDITKEPDLIYEFLLQNKITGGSFATAIDSIVVKNYDLEQWNVGFGGEALRDIKSDNVQIFNDYGPTECMVFITDYKLEKGIYYQAAPLGRPLYNHYVFILDRYSRLLPRGVAGEICAVGR